MILDIRNANRTSRTERSEHPDLDQESTAPKHAGFASRRQDRGWTTDARFAVALPQNERLGTRSFTPPRVSRLERGPPQQSISTRRRRGAGEFRKKQVRLDMCERRRNKAARPLQPGVQLQAGFQFQLACSYCRVSCLGF